MTKKHVLIVGEDDLIAWAIRKRFSAMQIPVRVVRTRGEALAELGERPYGLVVFDPGLLEGEPAGSRMKSDPLEGIRFVEKPLNIFDLDRVVIGMVGSDSEKKKASE